MTDNKSTTKYIEIECPVEWAKVFEQNRDKEGPNGAYKSHGGAYSIDLLLDEANLKILADSGSQKAAGRAKAFNDAPAGFKRVNITRKHEAPFTYGGPPQVAKADGTAWDINEDGLIGNGSTAVVHLAVYEGGGLIGTRIEGLQVIKHQVYESESTGGGPRFKDRSADAETIGEKSESKPADTASDVVEDEIPFDKGGAS